MVVCCVCWGNEVSFRSTNDKLCLCQDVPYLSPLAVLPGVFVYLRVNEERKGEKLENTQPNAELESLVCAGPWARYVTSFTLLTSTQRKAIHCISLLQRKEWSLREVR